MNRTSVISCAAMLLAILPLASSAFGASATVRGRVRFEGEPPAAQPFLITKDNAVCGEGNRMVDVVRVDDDGMLGDVMVLIDGPISGHPAPTEDLRINQVGCRFAPSLQGAKRGASITIVNDDPIAHNIHAYQVQGRLRRDLFSFQQPHLGHRRVEKLRVRRAEVVELRCDRHNFMRGWILVVANPFVTVAEDGLFEIAGVPPGSYELRAFHPVLGWQRQEVELEAGEAATEVDFVYSSPSD